LQFLYIAANNSNRRVVCNAMTDFMKFQIFSPINGLLLDEELTDYFRASIQELLEINSLEFDIPVAGNVLCKITLDDKFISQSQKTSRAFQALVFIIEVPEKEAEATIYDGTSETKEISVENYVSLVATEFKIQLTNFLLFLQIAKPGAFRTREGDLFVNDEYYGSYESISSIHQEAFLEIKKIGWPKFKNLKYQDVITWYKQFNLSFEKMADRKAEIALNAFSYLFQDRTDMTLDLFWSLIGIEALYCTGKEGKAEQIFEKTQVVLGSISDFKKKVKTMYNFRSRLIHGDLNIPSAISKHFSLKEFEEYSDEFYDATIFSVAILTATLQELIYLKKDSLLFKTVLV
jgi:hypothetical protein